MIADGINRFENQRLFVCNTLITSYTHYKVVLSKQKCYLTSDLLSNKALVPFFFFQFYLLRNMPTKIIPCNNFQGNHKANNLGVQNSSKRECLTDSAEMSLSKLWEMVRDREA